ncbi:hypothetical protein TVAG_228700 [Trichomonas vaginalis G3]|uniref:Uncharacterized protein n=1 Tax=Trichomonas vaginalis (strain ATCC PRA-98 / G3) TaxID=412133 RepID=A2DJ32_TRIV3|nr:hypothetical protein TVAGG3_0470820 [Trichomonas vaginalis G3]EAY19607.1 hypothetical protein TVAG_228700 [Trichomonas vaginalis G3]KAI5515047.1 hypothetical protein TVAGG3_0470820 [Trichomonas vaginalis G3]|eukprot:XP_001580593.1 hypothetical protein [Trichomonas vaginalis G3]
MSKKQQENYIKYVSMRSQDRLFNQSELNPKLFQINQLQPSMSFANCANDIKLNTNYERPTRPSSTPLPVYWTKLDLIFGKYD